jgi:hypothetical protein
MVMDRVGAVADRPADGPSELVHLPDLTGRDFFFRVAGDLVPLEEHEETLEKLAVASGNLARGVLGAMGFVSVPHHVFEAVQGYQLTMQIQMLAVGLLMAREEAA